MTSLGERGWPIDPGGITPTGDVDRWALIVGISDYQSVGLSLKFAARDATALHETLLTPTAGAFPDDHILTLVDKEATLANLTKALRTFLKKPAAEDLVLLFFACHGSRDRDRPDDLYLLPHDTDPADISGTALPMRDLEFALRQTLHSRRIVALVDACHSGGVGDVLANLRGAADDAADLNTFLNALSSSRGGVSLMTSAMESESSVEGTQWGEGHGVFTHFLLEGLRGKADRPPYDGVVTVGELFDYVASRVKEETDDRQHPHISSAADRALVLSVTGSLSANQHLELAGRLAEAAEVLAERTLWRGAAVQYGEVIRLRREAVHEDAGLAQSLALYRSGNPRAAEMGLIARAPDGPDGRRALGLLQLVQGRSDDARATLLEPEPIDPWLPILFSPSIARGRRVALLVGLNVLDPVAYGGFDGRLGSPGNEVKTLGNALKRDFGFEEQIRLLDSAATRTAILGALSDLISQSGSCEAIVVCLSGHGGQEPVSDEAGRQVDTTFVAFDGQIRSLEFDALLRSSAAARTTLIVSSAHAGRFAQRAATGGYDVLAACDEGQFDYDDSQGNLGVFLASLLPNLKPGATGKRVAAATVQTVHRKSKAMNLTMDPQFVVAGDRPVLVGSDKAGSGSGAVVLAEIALGVAADVADDVLDRIASLVNGGEIPDATARAIAVEWWRRNQAGKLAGLGLTDPADALATTCVRTAAAARVPTVSSLAESLAALAARPAVATNAGLVDELQKLSRDAEGTTGTPSRIRAVLVGLTRFADGRDGLEIAKDGVDGVRAALDAGGTPGARIATLVDTAATKAAIRAALKDAGRDGIGHPVLVYWCGPGTLDGLSSFDGGGLSQVEIAKLAGPNLTLVGEGIDLGPPAIGQDAPSHRPRLVVLFPRDSGKGRPASVVSHARLDGRAGKARYGRLTIALFEALRRPAGLADLRASSFAAAAGPATVVATPGRDSLVADPIVARVDNAIGLVVGNELIATVTRLRALLDQRNGIDPEAQLQLGILSGEIGDIDDAVEALETAVRQFGADNAGEARAHLHLGRVLLAGGRDRARAVSECRQATDRDPELVEAWFWLGRAMSELVLRETATEASDALRTYLSRGAPIGRRGEVMQIIASMARDGR